MGGCALLVLSLVLAVVEPTGPALFPLGGLERERSRSLYGAVSASPIIESFFSLLLLLGFFPPAAELVLARFGDAGCCEVRGEVCIELDSSLAPLSSPLWPCAFLPGESLLAGRGDAFLLPPFPFSSPPPLPVSGPWWRESCDGEELRSVSPFSRPGLRTLGDFGIGELPLAAELRPLRGMVILVPSLSYTDEASAALGCW